MADSNLILGKFMLDSRVTFQIYPAALYGDVFRNCTPTELVTANTARKMGIDPEVDHAKAYPYLPTGAAQDNASSYKWLVVVLEDGTERIIGLPWIKVDTIVSVQVVNAVVTIPNIAQGDVEKIRLAISGQGFSNFTIETKVSG